MRYLLILVAACLPGGTSHAQDSSSPRYEALERRFEELIGVWLDGGKACPERTAEVIEKQWELAQALNNATPEDGPGVLQFAVIANSLGNVRRLNESGASRVAEGSYLLHDAATFADPPMLEYLTSIGFGVEESGNANGPALKAAVQANRLDSVLWLVEHGANVNATDRGGASVLLHSLTCGDQRVVDILVEAGAVPDARARALAERRNLHL